MSDTKTNVTTSLKVPTMWKVIIHNDDFTPVDFVVALIHKLFNKSLEEAMRLTYAVHNNGKANVGVYTKEVAMTKIALVKENAEIFQHPLLATAEEA
jgi:ATP-dependent Clp protease adaptor protein ClpS